jgi:hypothetical protein
MHLTILVFGKDLAFLVGLLDIEYEGSTVFRNVVSDTA